MGDKPFLIRRPLRATDPGGFSNVGQPDIRNPPPSGPPDPGGDLFRGLPEMVVFSTPRKLHMRIWHLMLAIAFICVEFSLIHSCYPLDRPPALITE
jgi:hypothetical protein